MEKVISELCSATEKVNFQSTRRGKSSRPKLNPLLMEPILEIIFDYLPVRDLQQCYPVCKLWLKESTRIKNKRETARLVSQEDLNQLMIKLSKTASTKLNKLETENLDLEDSVFKSLLLKIEPTLSILILDYGKVTQSTFHKILLSVPNLVRLELGPLKTINGMTFELFPVYNERRQIVILDKLESLEYFSYIDPPTSLSAAFKTFPNLKSVTVKNFRAEPPSRFNGIRMPHLRELSIHSFPGHKFQNVHIEMLRKVKFESIRCLKLQIIDENTSIPLLQSFIESFRETLIDLHLTYIKESDHNPQAMETFHKIKVFPLNLPKLQNLVVDKPYVQNVANAFNTLPDLKSIVFLRFKNFEWKNVIPKNCKKQFKQVGSMTINHIDPKPLEMLCNIFSGVTILQISNCDDNILRTVFSNMPLLEALVCCDSESHIMTTEGFTGIPQKYFMTDYPDDGVPIENHRSMPYIGHLTRLRHAWLYFTKTDCCAGNILMYGLMDIRSLKTVTFTRLEFSTKLIEYLENDCEFQVVPHSLLRNYCADGDDDHTIFRGDLQEAFSEMRHYTETVPFLK